MTLDDTDCELVERALDRRAHEHFHFVGFSTNMRLQSLGVILWPIDIGADFEQSLHVLKVFCIWILQTDPHVLHLVILFEVDRR